MFVPYLIQKPKEKKQTIKTFALWYFYANYVVLPQNSHSIWALQQC